MPISKGIDVQKSRFAALALETSSESEEGGDGEWERVKKAHKAGAAAKPHGQKGSQRVGQDGESKPLSKNAKKRARKKKQQQAQGASEVSPDGAIASCV